MIMRMAYVSPLYNTYEPRFLNPDFLNPIGDNKDITY